MAQNRAAKSPYYPRVDLELGATSDKDIDGVDGSDRDLTAMVRLRYNLYAGGKDKAHRKETAHFIQQALEVRNRACRQVVEEMRLSWNAYLIANARLESLDRHVASSESARNAYRKQFNLAERSLLDLLDSENELFSARSAYLDGQYDRLFAAYRRNSPEAKSIARNERRFLPSA